MEIIKHDAIAVPESSTGVCLWQMPQQNYGGGFLASEPGVFLSMFGVVDDPRIEAEVEKAARYWLEANSNEYIGRPYWMRGVRKVTDSERDDMVERLNDGKIPDWEEEARIAMREAKKK